MRVVYVTQFLYTIRVMFLLLVTICCMSTLSLHIESTNSMINTFLSIPYGGHLYILFQVATAFLVAGLTLPTL